MAVTILFKHPMKAHATRPAPVLEFIDRQKKQFFFEPEVRKNQAGEITVYTVPEEYARQLLSQQPERYFLLSPDSMMIRFKTGFATDYRKVTKVDLGQVLSRPLVATKVLGAPKPAAPAVEMAAPKKEEPKKEESKKEDEVPPPPASDIVDL